MSKLHFYQHGGKKEFPIEFNTRTKKCKVLKYGIILFGRKLNIKHRCTQGGGERGERGAPHVPPIKILKNFHIKMQ
jgi:hypothetical protein